ncbi:MAG: hypothetical protein JWN99_1265, partial [Ilumatobacteraceae bacterium]|nr:hypothetical protein [Ilumatobacteraceae bacterium]
MAPHDHHADRTKAVEGLTSAQLARAVAVQPHVAAWTLGAGPLRGFIGRNEPKPSRRQLAAVLSNPHTVRITLDMLSPCAYQLAMLAASRGGTLTAPDIESELAPISPDQRSALVDELAERLLIEPTRVPLTLRAGIANMLGRPGRPLDWLLLDQSIISDEIAFWLTNLGVQPIPSKKGQRIEALRAVITTPESLRPITSALGPEAAGMFERLFSASGAGASLEQLGASVWQLRTLRTFPPRSRHNVPLTGATGALQTLYDLGLVWVDERIDRAGLWM